MKNLKSTGVKLFILISVSLLFLASRLTKPDANEPGFTSISVTPVPDSQFIIGAFHNGKDVDYQYQKELNLNTWHYYTGPYGGWFGYSDDHYDKDTGLYKNFVIGIIDENNNDKDMRTLMDRPIIEYLIGGQRIDYQCEHIDSNFSVDRYWFYAYRYSLNNDTTVYDTTDNSQYGTGEIVKKCRKTEYTTANGYVLIDSNLRANRELGFTQTNDWMRDDAYKWYIMPRIRIDSAFAADGNNDNIPVCKIVLHGWNDTVVKEIIIKVENFKDSINNLYDGNYKEIYNFLLGQTKLEIDTAEIRQYFIHPGGNTFWWEGEINKTDIKIYWSGKCDMWIDRVRIENRPAHEFLTLKDNRWISKVNSEIFWAGGNYSSGNPVPNYFYFEECQMSHFPVIKELNRQITESSGGRNELVVFLNYDLFRVHIPYDWRYKISADLLKKYLYDDYGLRTIIMGTYPLEGFAFSEAVDDLLKNVHFQ